MSAVIIDLAEARERKQSAGGHAHFEPCDAPSTFTQPMTPTGRERFQFWTGASGKRYVHTVYDLLNCPTLPASNYMLVKRSADGELDVLAIGQVSNQATSLNLAEIRRHGAELGASEVHIHLLADDAVDAKHIQHDLQTGYLNATWPDEKSAWAN